MPMCPRYARKRNNCQNKENWLTEVEVVEVDVDLVDVEVDEVVFVVVPAAVLVASLPTIST